MEHEEYKPFFKKVKGAEGDKCYYPTRLDTYGKGCYFNCRYCYAKTQLEIRHFWNPNNPAVADINKIRRKVKTLKPGTIVRLGGLTDCFQPIEEEEHITYDTIQALNGQKVGYLIVTKSDLVATKEYMDIMDKRLAHIQISIPATDNKILAQLDNAPTFERRKQAIETLYENGFDTAIRVSPYIPPFIDIGKINEINCNKVLVEFLRIPSWVEKDMKEIMDISDFSLIQRAMKHLPLEKKLELLSRINKEQVSVCDDVDEHYDYFKYNFNYNPDDCCNLNNPFNWT